jgi:hypothetical protein
MLAERPGYAVNRHVRQLRDVVGPVCDKVNGSLGGEKTGQFEVRAIHPAVADKVAGHQ